jgi:hypothetical protein
VGSRRFRHLTEILRPSGIELDLICGRVDNAVEESGVFAAGNFAPFAALMKALSQLKRMMAGSSDAISSVRPTLSTASAQALSDEEATADSSLTSLLLSFESLPDGDAGWVLPATLAGLQSRKKYDFVISTAPPWSSHIAAIMVGKRYGLPVILDDRDPWAGSAGRLLYMTHPWIRRLDRRLASHCYRRASGIVCVTEPACALHRGRRYGERVPIICLPNGFDPRLSERATAPMRQTRINISYVGSLYHGRSPMVVLEPALTLPPEIARSFHFHFVGNISPEEAARIEALNKPFGVTLYGSQSHDFCLERITQSDVCLLLAIGQPSQIPAKLYEYIGLQRPVLTVSDSDDATMQQMRERKWGWAADDRDSIAAALTDVYREWKADRLTKIGNEATRRFSFDTIAGEYAGFIRRLIAPGNGPTDVAAERSLAAD